MPFPALQAHRPHLGGLRGAAAQEPLGLYLHIPFCRDRCTYCSFATSRNGDLKPLVLARLGAELEAWGEALDHPTVDTVYFGGGTPSLLEPDEVAALLAEAQAAFDLRPVEEITLEANPGTLAPGALQRLRALGIDRLSLGVQTLDDTLLQRLGRIHDGATALDALREARAAGFQRLSADLMVGIPGQDLDRVLGDAATLVEAGATHLSVYLLDLDKACPLKAQVERGALALPDENAVADMFEALQAELPRLGLPGYEISNYARPGEESRHNLRYWERRPYLGLGPSAASHLGSWRWTECAALPAWIEGLGTPDVQGLSLDEELAEIPLLGLRLHRGVDWSALRAHAATLDRLDLVERWEAQLAPFRKHGLLAWDGDRLRLTPHGMVVSNGILQLFV
ncbi:MAG: Oxygen-independent coproporphyrinogen-III oxidase 1 [Acidobacteria bacterium ADurb.Bin340]|nr:MAG: Oxygen-independent coproporphyrinogen-III oxidase 1 [Acidobacteria bacterium ADurb.Bin340]